MSELEKKAAMEFAAKFDTICGKCGGQIKGYLGQHGVTRDTADKITWSRIPRADGLKVRWHVACNDMADNAEVIAKMLAKKGTGEDAEATPEPIPAPAPKSTPAPAPIPAPKALGGLEQMLADALLPHLEGRVKVHTAELSAQVEAKIKEIVASTSKRIVVENRKTGESKDVGRAHERFADLLTLVSAGENVYLVGPPGSGKSTGAQKVAEALSLTYGYISLSAQTAESRLLGYMDATGKYSETEFFRCYKNGGVFCIDEMDNASANLLTALNSALENGKAAFPCGVIDQHKDFVMVATGNTNGYGANPMFPERRPMDAAFRERFVFLEWSYDESLERDLALGFNDKAAKWIDWVQQVRKFAAVSFPKLMVTPRASIKGARLVKDFTPARVAEMVIFKGLDSDARGRILAANPLPRM